MKLALLKSQLCFVLGNMCLLRINLFFFSIAEKETTSTAFKNSHLASGSVFEPMQQIYPVLFLQLLSQECLYWTVLDYCDVVNDFFFAFCYLSFLVRSLLHHKFSQVFLVVLMMTIISVLSPNMEDMHLLPRIDLNHQHLQILLCQPSLLMFPRYAVLGILMCIAVYLMVDS